MVLARVVRTGLEGAAPGLAPECRPDPPPDRKTFPKSVAQNLTEKIAERHAVGEVAPGSVRSGDYLSLRPRHVLTHDNTAAVMKKFAGLPGGRIHDPSQPVFALDHDIQNRSEANLAKYAAIEAFAAEHGVDFHPAGRGIGHQVMIEEGYAWPGSLVVASDSHANVYGGIGCLGTPVVRTDAAALWTTGETWWQVPPVTRVVLEGRLPAGAAGKDVILTLCGLYANDEVLNHVVEFTGDGVAGLSIEERLTIANMTTEWGALAGLFPVDDTVLDWLRDRIGRNPRFSAEAVTALEAEIPRADPDADYAAEIVLDLGEVQPHVCGPDTVKVARPAAALARERIAVQKAYLLSCVNGRVEDFAAAAEVLRGHRVAPGVELYVAAASSEVQAESERRGDWQALLEAGAIPLPPGCGPCIGMGRGLLEDGEVGISATNRNFKGRMGSREARAYLASPTVVAASALHGYVRGPEEPEEVPPEPRRRIRRLSGPKTERAVELLEGFPESLSGELLFCDADNLNTDGIYPGKYTYREDLTPEDMARVVMENYDPRFPELVRPGDLLVGGANFGTGSSREQAATALAHAGVRAVLAASFSATYKRNALNNGLVVLECPELVTWLRDHSDAQAPTVRTGLEGVLDFRRGRVQVGDESFPFAPLGPAAQELVLAGGLEALLAQRLA